MHAAHTFHRADRIMAGADATNVCISTGTVLVVLMSHEVCPCCAPSHCLAPGWVQVHVKQHALVVEDGRWDFDEARQCRVQQARRGPGMQLCRGVLEVPRGAWGWLCESGWREAGT